MMRVSWLWVHAVVVSGCLQSQAIQCDDYTCPPETACDTVHATCVAPHQLQSCVGIADGTSCMIDAADDGICDREVCVIKGCGDGYVRGGEQCDGETVPPDANCLAINGYIDKTPTCTPDCTFDIASCEQYCGDAELQLEFEVCDGTMVSTKSCVDFGFGAGNLGCINCGPETNDCIPFGWQLTDVPGGIVSIAGASATDVYAVVLSSEPLVHFDGAGWSPVPLTGCTLTSTQIARFVGVPAAGVVFMSAGNALLRIANGTCTKWEPSTNEILGMSAHSASDVWVTVQDDGIYRFNGTTWTLALALTPQTTAIRLFGTGPDDVWTLQKVPNLGDHLRHWDGVAWSAPFIPAGIGDYMTGIWGSSPTDIYVSASSPGRIYHYDGQNWTAVLDHPAFANPESTVHGGLSAGGRTYALATTYSPTKAFVFVNEGNGWLDLDPPVSANGLGQVDSLWAATSGEVFLAVPNSARIAHHRGTVRVDRQVGPGGNYVAELEAIGPNSVYAMVSDLSPQLMHWDGESWNNENVQPSDISISPSGTVFAVSATGLRTSSGGSWSAPEGAVSGQRVFAVDNDDVFIVDLANPGTVHHWHAAGDFETYTYPTPNQERVYEVWGTSTSNMLFAGGKGQDAAIYHFNATTNTWTSMTLPADISQIALLRGNAADDVFAVSTSGQLLHYNGNAWTERETPAQVNDVWGSEGDLFAATYYGIQHHDGTAWSPVAAGLPVGVSRLASSGSTLMYVDYVGEWHQLVRLTPW